MLEEVLEQKALHDAAYQRALIYIDFYSLNMTPETFSLFYHYSLGTKSPAQERLEALILNNEVTPESLAAITRTPRPGEHGNVFCISTAKDHLRKQAAKTHQIVESHAATVSRFNAKVGSSSEELRSTPSMERLQDFVEKLTAACEEVQHQNALIEKQLFEVRRRLTNFEADLTEIRGEAQIDPLTKLLNRPAFQKRISSAVSQAAPRGSPICLAICRIDRLDELLAKHGLFVAEQVISHAAKTLRLNARAADIIAHLGSGRFAITFPSTPVDDASRLAERIRLEVAGIKITRRSTKESLGKLSLSIGLVQNDTCTSVEELFLQAEEMLLLAQSEGGNRVRW